VSALEDQLEFHIKAAKLPQPEREYVFAKPRKFRFDFCWPDMRLAAEVEGGTWVGGRHTRGTGFEKDAEKYNLATLGGWRVLRFTGKHIRNGVALQTIIEAMGER
jgi:very-short-patch-repair endonuclease